MKKAMYSGLLLFFITFLCGCNSNVPDLSEEQTALITEYATNLLVKHSELSQRNLLSESELEKGILEEEEERERKLKEEEIAQAYLNAEVEMVDSDLLEDGQADDGTAEVMEPVPAETISEFLEEENFMIDYISYELCDSYPETGEDDIYMAMDATPGHQLCIVKFEVQNVTSVEQELDMLGKRGRFTLHSADGETVFSQATMLLNDLSSYRGNIPGNVTEQMVLVFEVSDGISQMESAELVMKTESGENVVLLY